MGFFNFTYEGSEKFSKIQRQFVSNLKAAEDYLTQKSQSTATETTKEGDFLSTLTSAVTAVTKAVSDTLKEDQYADLRQFSPNELVEAAVMVRALIYQTKNQLSSEKGNFKTFLEGALARLNEKQILIANYIYENQLKPFIDKKVILENSELKKLQTEIVEIGKMNPLFDPQNLNNMSIVSFMDQYTKIYSTQLQKAEGIYVVSIDPSKISSIENKEFTSYLGKKIDRYQQSTIMVGTEFGNLKKLLNREAIKFDTFQIHQEPEKLFATKVFSLYAQIHKIAKENPGKSIQYELFTDSTEENRKLVDLFFNNPQLLPEGIIIYFIDKETKKNINTGLIMGKGIADENYQKTVETGLKLKSEEESLNFLKNRLNAITQDALENLNKNYAELLLKNKQLQTLASSVQKNWPKEEGEEFEEESYQIIYDKVETIKKAINSFEEKLKNIETSENSDPEAIKSLFKLIQDQQKNIFSLTNEIKEEHKFLTIKETQLILGQYLTQLDELNIWLEESEKNIKAIGSLDKAAASSLEDQLEINKKEYKTRVDNYNEYMDKLNNASPEEIEKIKTDTQSNLESVKPLQEEFRKFDNLVTEKSLLAQEELPKFQEKQKEGKKLRENIENFKKKIEKNIIIFKEITESAGKNVFK